MRKLNPETRFPWSTGPRDKMPMATLWHFPREIGKERPRPPRIWTSKRLEGSQLGEIRVSSGQAVSVRVERIAARGKETVEGTRKGWRESWQRRRSWGASGGGSGRRWNTNMRIKAVEGIKAYNRDADLSERRLCLRAYIYICLFHCISGYSYVRSSTDLGRSVDIGRLRV